jgi:hypothetical protein
MVENGARFGGSTKRMSMLKEHRAYQAETVSPTSPSYIRKISAGPLVRFIVIIATVAVAIILEPNSYRNLKMGSSWWALPSLSRVRARKQTGSSRQIHLNNMESGSRFRLRVLTNYSRICACALLILCIVV